MNTVSVMRLVSCLFFCVLLFPAKGTHLKSGEITIRHKDNASAGWYTITLSVYTRYQGSQSVLFSSKGGGQLDFGDKSAIHHPPEQHGVQLLDEIYVVRYSVDHNYITTGEILVSYTEPNFNSDILNFSSSVSTPFRLESSFKLDLLRPYVSPEFGTPSAFVFARDLPFSFSAASTSSAMKTLYTLTKPVSAIDYKIPTNLSVDPNTGLLTWDSNFLGPHSVAGEFVFAVRVYAYDENNLIRGWCERLIDVIIEDTNSKLSITNSAEAPDFSVQVLAGETRKVKFFLQDKSDVADLSFQMDADPLLAENVLLTQHDSLANGTAFRVGTVEIHTTAGIVRDNPYIISLHGLNRKSGVNSAVDANVLLYTKEHTVQEVVTGVKPEVLSFSAYPNPFRSQLFVSGANTGAQIKIRNSFGEVVLEDRVQTDLPVNTSRLIPGFYILDVVDGNRVGRMKVVSE